MSQTLMFQFIYIFATRCRLTFNISTFEIKCCGMEDRTVVANGCRKTKKLICGTEGQNIVAYGRLPSPAHYACLSVRKNPMNSIMAKPITPNFCVAIHMTSGKVCWW